MTQHALTGLTAPAAGWIQIALGLARGSKGGPTDQGANPDDPETWRGDMPLFTAEAWRESIRRTGAGTSSFLEAVSTRFSHYTALSHPRVASIRQ